MRTAADDHMSELKCSASASKAGLEVSTATRVEHAGTIKVDGDGGDDHAERDGGGLHRVGMIADQPLGRFPHHHARENEQQRGLGERGDVLDLAVAVLVVPVGRLVGHAHREIGHHRRGEVDQGMGGLRQDGERAGGDADHGLAERQPARGGDRAERDAFLFSWSWSHRIRA